MSSSNENSRPSWDKYFMEISDTVSKRATCDRGKSGCVIVREKQINAGSRKKKLDLVNNFNTDWHDLYDEI